MFKCARSIDLSLINSTDCDKLAYLSVVSQIVQGIEILTLRSNDNLSLLMAFRKKNNSGNSSRPKHERFSLV